MARNIVTGIDIGTYHVKVVIAEKSESGFPTIIGTGIAESKGVRHGYISNQEEISACIREAVDQAEQVAQVRIKRAYVSVGGIGLGSIVCSSSTIISRADLEITQLDIKKVHDQCEKDIPANLSLNKKIIHSIPLTYKIDGKVVLGKPENMKGNRLEVKMLFITCLERHLDDILQSIEEAGVDIQDVMASPIAASFVILSKSQKIAGCVLANIGAETVSIAVFENNVPVSLEVFPIGSSDITNDIALGLKVPLEEAEQIKIGSITNSSYPRRKLEEIIYARLSDIFELIEAHLKKIGRNGLLPAGIIITGGGSGLTSIDELAKAALHLPSKIGAVMINGRSKDNFKDSTWSVAYGLCVFGLGSNDTSIIDTSVGKGFRALVKIKERFLGMLKQFLP